MTEATQPEPSELLGRDAHLSELTVNRHLAGELDPASQAFVDDHLAGCAPCTARVQAVQQFDAAFSIAPPVAPPAVVSLDAERARRAPQIIIGLLVAAAAVVLALNFGGDDRARVSPHDDIRFKGSDLALEVFAKSGDGRARSVGDGDVVHPGDRLGFKVTSRVDGFAMIVGVDDHGQVYAGWPQQSGGKAEFLAGAPAQRDLESAVRLDHVGDTEVIILVRCDTAFDQEAVAKHLAGPTALQKKPQQDPLRGCVYDRVTLKKKPR